MSNSALLAKHDGMARLPPSRALFLFLLTVGCGRDPRTALLAQLHNPNVESRRAAARDIGKLESIDAPLATALASSLGDPDAEVRRLAAVAIGHAGPAAATNVAALDLALADREPAVRRAAAWAIQKIDPNNTNYTRVLIEAMRSGDGRTLLQVGALGPDAAWAVPALTELTSNNSDKLRALAAQTLGRIGPPATSAKPALTRLLQDPSPAVQDAATAALKQIAP